MEIYLSTFGARLRVKDGLYEVTVPDMSGANNHIVEQYAAHQVEAILFQRGSSVSADVMLLAFQHGTDIVVLDHFGNPQGRLYPNEPNNTIKLWKAQLLLSETAKGLDLARAFIIQKLKGRLNHLRKLKARRNAEKCVLIVKAEQEIGNYLHKIKELIITNPIANAATLRGLEGMAGRIYFDTLCALMPDDYTLNGRNFRPTLDIFNAFLNYGYGILYRKIEKALHQVGLNPYIGLMHNDGHKKKSMVYDCIEAFRAWIEAEVFKLFTRKIAQPHHSIQIEDKGIWLNEAGKQILVTTLSERFNEPFDEADKKDLTFETYLKQSIRQCATKILRGVSTDFDLIFSTN